MDFFAQQDLARRNTRLLVLLFLAAVLLLILMTTVAVAAGSAFSAAVAAGMTSVSQSHVEDAVVELVILMPQSRPALRQLMLTT